MQSKTLLWWNNLMSCFFTERKKSTVQMWVEMVGGWAHERQLVGGGGRDGVNMYLPPHTWPLHWQTHKWAAVRLTSGTVRVAAVEIHIVVWRPQRMHWDRVLHHLHIEKKRLLLGNTSFNKWMLITIGAKENSTFSKTMSCVCASYFQKINRNFTQGSCN